MPASLTTPHLCQDNLHNFINRLQSCITMLRCHADSALILAGVLSASC